MTAYFEEQLKVIGDAVRSINEAVFEQWVHEAAGTIGDGHKIIVSGLGKNVPICEKFVGSMVSMGMDACFLHTNSAVHGDMGIVKDKDLVIILSKSGETAESVYLARLLQKRGTNLWLLSFTGDSTLAAMIPKQLVINLAHEGDLWNIMPNNSTTMNLIVLQALAMQIAKEMGLGIEAFRRNHPGGQIGRLLTGDVSWKN